LRPSEPWRDTGFMDPNFGGRIEVRPLL
jgi:hypothetical protein